MRELLTQLRVFRNKWFTHLFRVPHTHITNSFFFNVNNTPSILSHEHFRERPGIQDVLRILHRKNLEKLKRLFIIKTLLMLVKFLKILLYILLWYFSFTVLNDFYILHIDNLIDVYYGFLVLDVISSPSLPSSLPSFLLISFLPFLLPSLLLASWPPTLFLPFFLSFFLPSHLLLTFFS